MKKRSNRLVNDSLSYHGKSIKDWIKSCVQEAKLIEANRLASELNISAKRAFINALFTLRNNLPGNISKSLKNKLNEALESYINKVPRKISRDIVRTCNRVINKIVDELPVKHAEAGREALESALNANVQAIRTDIRRIKRNKDNYGKTELWIIILFMLVDWYVSHNNELFFQKYSTIQTVLESYGYDCTIDGIEEALRVLKNMDLIKITYPRDNDGKIISKSAWIAAGNNPNHYIFRAIEVKWANLYPWMQVYTSKGLESALKRAEEKANKNNRDNTNKVNYGAKSRFRKLVKKRPISRLSHEIFELAMADAGYEHYKSEREMLSGFIATYGSKYYNPIKFIKGYRPEHMINLQKEQDDKALSSVNDDLALVRASKAEYTDNRCTSFTAVQIDNLFIEEANEREKQKNVAKRFFEEIR